MRIKFIESLSTNRETFLGNAEYELDDVEARQAIRAGIAVEVKATKKSVEQPKPIADPKPEVKKPEAKPVEKK